MLFFFYSAFFFQISGKKHPGLVELNIFILWNLKFTPTSVNVEGKQFERDKWTNVTPNILGYLNRNLHLKPQHPLSLLRENIVSYMYKKFPNYTGNPLFSVYDRFSPIVTTHQNFDRYCINYINNDLLIIPFSKI